MSLIDSVRAREFLDSRGDPTIEVDVSLDDGAFGRAAVPSGASTGEHEALELRDGEPGRFGGKGVLKAVANVHDAIAPAIDRDRRLRAADGRPRAAGARRLGRQVEPRRERDPRRLPRHGEGRRRLTGAARSGAPSAGRTRMSCPTPMLNVINGGAHADNELELQEFMVMPVGASSFSEALRWGCRVLPRAQAHPSRQGIVDGGR